MILRTAHCPDAPDFVGLTEADATRLAAERGLVIHFFGDGHRRGLRTSFDPGRVLAVLDRGVIVEAKQC